MVNDVTLLISSELFVLSVVNYLMRLDNGQTIILRVSAPRRETSLA